jgi:ATP-dependent Clp protease adaptor protein ClpS
VPIVSEHKRFQGSHSAPLADVPREEKEICVEPEETTGDSNLEATVVLYNDDYHVFADVVAQLIKAIGCSHSEAVRHAFAAHCGGSARVFRGCLTRSLDVSSVLGEIGLKTEVTC